MSKFMFIWEFIVFLFWIIGFISLFTIYNNIAVLFWSIPAGFGVGIILSHFIKK